jgi:NAD+ kinase
LKNVADNIKRIGVIGNSGKVSFAGVASRAARLVRSAGRKLYTDAITAGLVELKPHQVLPDAAALAREVDLVLIFGGDGTMLRVAREIAGSRTPMLGINIGGLGFLTAVPSTELPQALKKVWNGDYSFEQRLLLQASGRSNGQVIEQSALNDIVISRGIASRLIELDVRVDGASLTRYRCDGLIISSPTGSTAYSLAAGGAVMFPTTEVIGLTPICPHTLTNRSLILPGASVIEVKVISPKPATVLSGDGQMVTELAENDILTIRRSRRSVRLMRLSGSSFCETLRKKLHWRGGTL